MSNTQPFTPNWVSVPGDTIKDLLEERGIGIQDFAGGIGKSSDFVNALLIGQESIDEVLARKLAESLGGPAKFWMNREQDYRADLARLNKEWLAELPTKDMKQKGWIDASKDLLQTCLDFFGVSDFQAWRDQYREFIPGVAFRRSPSFATKNASAAAWLRQGERIANAREISSWDKELFIKTLPEIRAFTRISSPEKFLPKLLNACGKCGVSLAIVPTPNGCPASGATKFLSTGRAMILLSNRYQTDDQFWFTFFHEAGHLILHSLESARVEISDPDFQDSDEEKEANAFASDQLIPSNFQVELAKLPLTRDHILSFAHEVGICPGVIVGQLQHIGRIPHSRFNGLKRTFPWEKMEPFMLIIP